MGLTHREIATVFRAAGYSMLGPIDPQIGNFPAASLIKVVKDKLFVAGLSNEEFASTLRKFARPASTRRSAARTELRTAPPA